MKVQVLGTGCARCDNLYNNAVLAVGRIPELAQTVHVEKVGDPEVFFRLKVHVTPGLVINDEVVATGKVLSVDEIESELVKRRTGEGQ